MVIEISLETITNRYAKFLDKNALSEINKIEQSVRKMKDIMEELKKNEMENDAP